MPTTQKQLGWLSNTSLQNARLARRKLPEVLLKGQFLSFQERRMCGRLVPNVNGNRVIYLKWIIWVVGEFIVIGQIYGYS